MRKWTPRNSLPVAETVAPVIVVPKAATKFSKSKRANPIPGWREIAAQVKTRDRHQCRICGAPDRSETLHVHHMDWDRGNNNLRNLVLLCSRCHTNVHSSNYKPGQDDDYPAPWGEHPSEDGFSA